MPDRSQEQHAVSLQQRLESLAASLPNANAPAVPAESLDRPPRPVALTLRLDASRYAKLNSHAARYTPRRAFQAIITEALDMYLAQ